MQVSRMRYRYLEFDMEVDHVTKSCKEIINHRLRKSNLCLLYGFVWGQRNMSNIRFGSIPNIWRCPSGGLLGHNPIFCWEYLNQGPRMEKLDKPTHNVLLDVLCLPV